MPDAKHEWIVIDTLGKLLEQGFGLRICCDDCAARYRRDAPDASPTAMFKVDLPALIAQRGTNCRLIGMAPLPCPGCRGMHTSFLVSAPSMGQKS